STDRRRTGKRTLRSARTVPGAVKDDKARDIAWRRKRILRSRCPLVGHCAADHCEAPLFKPRISQARSERAEPLPFLVVGTDSPHGSFPNTAQLLSNWL